VETAGAAGTAAVAGGADGAAGSGATAFDGLGATAKAGVTAGVMAAAVATALTLALVTDGQRSRGPYSDPGTQPSAASVPGGPETKTGAEAKGSRARTVPPEESADAADTARGSEGREPAPPSGAPSGSGPAPASGFPPVPESAPTPGVEHDPGDGPEPGDGDGPGSGASSPGSGPGPGRPAGPTSRPSAATVHRLDRLPRGGSGGADGPAVREGSSWLWQRSELRVGGRDRGYGVTVSARSSVTVDLGGGCTSFDALVGVDDLTALRGAVRFSVHADGVRLWESGVVRRGEEPVPVHVSLAGRRTLHLVVEPHSALDAAVAADWVQARIGCG
jgi:hypothetical protein